MSVKKGETKEKNINEIKIEPKVSDVLKILGYGTILLASAAFPGLPVAVSEIEKIYKEIKKEKDLREWEKFNLWRLKQMLKRLRKQKIVKIISMGRTPIVVLTDKGRLRFLKYRVEEMVIKNPPKWDRKWRLITYDIGKRKRGAQEAFREILKRLKFLKLQQSVYLYPYPCEREIEFLRQYYGIGDEVIVLTANSLENEIAYKKYFGL